MKTLGWRRLVCLLGAWLIAALIHVLAQEAGVGVTPELLHNRIASVQDSTELDSVTKARLVELYRQSVGNLEATAAREESAEEYRKAARDAPMETVRLREAIERRRGSDPTVDLRDLRAKSAQQLSSMLDEETANLTAVEAELAILDARLEEVELRPAEAWVRITAARSVMEDLAATFADHDATGDAPQIVEAERWAVETRLETLRAEIAMLDQELLSHAARTELLQTQRDNAALGVEAARQRVDFLRAAVGERRREEIDLATAQARDALSGVFSDQPLVRDLAEANLELVEQLQAQLAELDEVAARERTRPRAAEIDNAFRNARRKLALEGTRAPVGAAIQAERRRFPSVAEYERQRRAISRSIVGVSLRLIEADEERRALGDIGAYVETRITETGLASVEPSVRAELESLARTRLSLLDHTVANDALLQRRFYAAEDALHRLTERMTAYDVFLAQRLLWARSNREIDLGDLAHLAADVRDYLRPGPWRETIRLAAQRTIQAPYFLLAIALAVVLALRAGRARAALLECGRNVGRVQEDSTASTVHALALTVLLAAPVPLVLGAIGGALSTAAEADVFASGVGSALLIVTVWIALPILMRALFLRGGVANRHFGWDDETTARLHRQLGWFIGFMFPVYFVLRTSLAVTLPVYAGGALTFLCFLIINIGLVVFIVATLHPTRGTIWRSVGSRSSGAQWRWRYLGFPLVVALPVALGFLGWIGYSYTSQQLLRRLLVSTWVLVVIWVGAAVVRRWLLLTARRLAVEADATRQSPAPQGAAVVARNDDDLGAPEVDLVALSNDSRRLLHAAVLLVIALALAAVWQDMIPALGILKKVELWSHVVTLDGVERSVPVTLFDLLLATVVGVGGYLMAKNLPSLLDILLLKHGGVSAGGRYTAGTLTRYAITATSALVALHLLGASASQLGWAAAALGVGIGFGLQEIVANFICGLILLFERPVRVGDVITIGDASGIVSKIRIRATTIRDWELKELVVPNKELITGRLLNWTLSDSVTRIFITVGVAYGTDTDKAMALMREAAEENALVLDDPEPRVHFEQFGESSLNLTLRAYTGNVTDRLPVTTELHQAIDRKFRAAGIVIAFPQRDVHLHPVQQAPVSTPPRS